MSQPHEFYPTPKWAVRAFAESGWQAPSRLHEPCVGDGSIIRVLRQAFPSSRWTATDIITRAWIQGGAPDEFQQRDFRQCSLDLTNTHVITNPAFSLATDLLVHFLGRHRLPITMLVRATWMESFERNRLLLHHRPSAILQLPKRFKQFGGQDNCGRLWVTWQPGHQGDTKWSLAVHPRNQNQGELF